MKAYLKDVEAEADYSSKLLKEKAETAKNEDLQHSEKKAENLKVSPPSEVVSGKREETTSQPVWCEAKSDEGHIYYWNIETGGKNLTEFSLLNRRLLHIRNLYLTCVCINFFVYFLSLYINNYTRMKTTQYTKNPIKIYIENNF